MVKLMTCFPILWLLFIRYLSVRRRLFPLVSVPPPFPFQSPDPSGVWPCLLSNSVPTLGIKQQLWML
jgi:hypothetical protein